MNETDPTTFAKAGLENIFIRLSAYTPSPERIPLEDFCTEMLAWCLIHSPDLQREFLEQIRRSNPKEVDPFTDYREVKVSAQFSDVQLQNYRDEWIVNS
jgi:hypothetical protein